MDHDTLQNKKSLILVLLPKDVKDKLGRPGEIDPDRGVALLKWKSEIESQRDILNGFQIATVLSLGEEAEQTSSPKKTKTFVRFTFSVYQKLVQTLRDIMRSLKPPTAADPESFQFEVCTSCREVYSEVFKTQCSHFYCRNCLIRMVTNSLEDASLFPLNAVKCQLKDQN
ncbi:uncharacterized protein N7500_005976 [Penicillium coprophilum]|uniref:uncharacterized protein n=1 Tax=Penicillium coprophilum TaxID=36646 RepID=UPI00239F3A53|nr:uncharacterized protein N7500_005976 [Penicillium coprophilum]KAJ5164146.1 hypothetical protein N7500_005976 [Penicillium coprophilum]